MIWIKKYSLAILLIIFTGCSNEKYQTKTSYSGNYKYEYVTNDPTQTRIYTLDNGLKVYLSHFEKEPRIQIFTAVKAGGKNDPENNTGLAHYLEHMMFKGNKFFGTKDYEKEKPLLDSIEKLFNDYSKLGDENERKNLYKTIDELSNKAALFAIPNEYDKMISKLGGKNLNAYTSEDRTVYYVDIPSNEIDRFLKLEGSRFKQIVNRLFHTELEAVYEEKNRSLDSDSRKIVRAIYQSLFPNHPYGKQSVIGTIEHLKNPSITEINNYFDKYYRPNNVAICMSGELNFDKTIALIDKYFGDWKPNYDLVESEFEEQNKINSPIINEVFGPDKESVTIGYRFDGKNKKDLMKLKLIDMILANSTAGLIDLNLVQKQKVLFANSLVDEMNDFYVHVLEGTPKENQSLEEVKNLILGEIKNIKNGNFDNYLVNAVVNDLKKSIMLQDDSDNANYYRGDKMVIAFTRDITWKESIAYFDEISKITKEDLISFANIHYSENYAVVYKKTGKDNSIKKVEKPEISKIPLNRNELSDFHKKIDEIKVEKLQPKFIDFKSELDFYKIGNLDVIAKENKNNDLFNLTFKYEFGKNLESKIGLATSLMNYAGTEELSPEDIKKEFYKLGAEYSFRTSGDGKETSISLSGLSENMDASIKLFETLLNDPQATQNSLNKLVDRILKSRSDNKKNKDVILGSRLIPFGVYGKDNPANDVISSKTLKQTKVEELLTCIKKLKKYPHRILYYGNKNKEELSRLIKTYHDVPNNFIEVKNDIKYYKEKDHDKKYVFWTDFDMVQTEIILLSKQELLDNSKSAAIRLFNEYFGGGMNSIVFQEIREAQGLAYAVFSTYSQARSKDRSDYIYSYIGVQSDKQKEALSSMFNLINNLPESSQAFDVAKQSILNKIESERITNSSILSYYLNLEKRNIDYDIRKNIYEEVKNMNFENLLSFHKKYIKNKSHNILLIGNRENIDFKNLRKYGKVEEISLETLFGY